jgi:ProP effector
MSDAKNKQPRRAFTDVQPVLDKLARLHPQLFGKRFLPLKVGIYDELLTAHPGEFEPQELKAAMAFHARSSRYLEAVASNTKRHDLQGQPVDDIAPEHLHHAIMEVFRRRQQRAKEDLRPWVVSRLVAAIEACGLSRDEYTAKVNPKTDEAFAVLEDAFGEISARSAKRTALRRAYEASGKSVDEFADMYGLAPADVRAAVEP